MTVRDGRESRNVQTSNGTLTSQRLSSWRSWCRVIAWEIAITLVLVVSFLVLLALFMQSGLAIPGQNSDNVVERVVHVVQSVHLDRNGRPIWPVFAARCRETLPLVGAACLWLVGLSLAAGTWFGLRPHAEPVRWLVLIVSSVPSFVWPLLAFVLFPGRTFSIFSETLAWGWPALCLAIGDLNWLTGTTLVADAIRRETQLPHWRLSRALGRTAASDLSPRLAVTCTALLTSRLPHLIGGTIVLEALFRIDGIGLWSWNAIMESPPDPSVLVWVGGLGIVLSRAMHAVTVLVSAVAFPDQQSLSAFDDLSPTLLSPDPASKPAEDDIPNETDSHATLPVRSSELATGTEPGSVSHVVTVDLSLNGDHDSAGSDPDHGGDARRVRLASQISLWKKISADPATMPRPARWRTVWLRWKYYQQAWPEGRSRIRTGYAVAALWCMMMAGLWLHDGMIQTRGGALDRGIARTGIFEAASSGVPFGGNAAGDDVAHLVWHGWWQQLPAWGLCVLVLASAVPVSLASVLTAVCAGHWFARLGWVVTKLADGFTFLFEATPRMIWLLACFSVFPLDGLATRMTVAMGVLFMPQLYRAQRIELTAMRNSVFLEAMRVARVPWWRVFRDNVLVGHVWPVLCVQTPLILSNVVLTEAWLGYLGVRNRGEIFTWGSILGTGVDEFITFRPLAAFGQPFNDGVVWGPLLCLCLTICLLNTLGQFLKVVSGAQAGR